MMRMTEVAENPPADWTMGRKVLLKAQDLPAKRTKKAGGSRTPAEVVVKNDTIPAGVRGIA